MHKETVPFSHPEFAFALKWQTDTQAEAFIS